ncbi:MAG: outer membrane lipid asymmetry maintenance protein MlaD [Deltaproteobacteria bacterium]|nr:outer membrane lipid asymmetry maintenance protein MlaD [Deltaproteobacteria bacterium]
MKRASLEISVGIFVVLGIVCLAYLSIKLGKMEVLGGDSYRVTANFDSASGLRPGASIEIAGVEVGRVDRIVLDPEAGYTARVTLRINSEVPLQDDVIAAVRTRGIIGDKFVQLKPGGSERLLRGGGRIRETESSIDFEGLLSKYIHGSVD